MSLRSPLWTAVLFKSLKFLYTIKQYFTLHHVFSWPEILISLWIPVFLSFLFFLFWYNVYSTVHLTMGSSTYTFHSLTCNVNASFLMPSPLYLRPLIFISKLQVKGWALWSVHCCSHRALGASAFRSFVFYCPVSHSAHLNRGDPIPAGACPQASAPGRYFNTYSHFLCYLPSLETGKGSLVYGWRTAYLWHC